MISPSSSQQASVPLISVPNKKRTHTSLPESEARGQKRPIPKYDRTTSISRTTAKSVYRDDEASQACESRGGDSGYGSVVSSPNKDKGQPLRILDKPIPEDLKNRFIDFKILYTAPLWKAVSGKRNKNIGDISMKLRYKGETNADA
ncbi:hypothetical protein GGR53DRAFT_372606 [Hypoxylon sp. FL1150]|nr:hypothetical protein GGR53DRAFT_372606 [Hypoxylon sp. FL1150]